jgi:hypothetical protein
MVFLRRFCSRREREEGDIITTFFFLSSSASAECSEDESSNSLRSERKKSFEKGGGDYLVEGCRTVFSFLEIKQKGWVGAVDVVGLTYGREYTFCKRKKKTKKKKKGNPSLLSGGLMEARGCLACFFF